jgi:hypothetical protein
VPAGTVHRTGQHVTEIDINPKGAVNVLTGRIPPSLGNLTQLRKLYLSSAFVSSELHGEIPDSLQRLQELRCFYVSHGDLHGPMPAWLNSMPKLQGIMMRRNKLSGPFPDLSNLHDLRSLWFDEQNVSGTIFDSLRGLKRLHKVIGFNNKLVGRVPPNLCALGKEHCNLGDPFFWEHNSNKFDCPLPVKDCCMIKECRNSTGTTPQGRNLALEFAALDLPVDECHNKTQEERFFRGRVHR